MLSKSALSAVALSLALGTSAVAVMAASTDAPPAAADRAKPETRAEYDARRAALFDKVDADKDGTVTREELRAARDAMRDEHRAARFGAVDADKSGSVSRDEFTAQATARLNAMFDRLDADKDGQLSADEMKAHGRHGMRHDARAEGDKPAGEMGEGHVDRQRMGRGHHRGGHHRDGLWGAFGRADADRDGSITRAEFDAAGAARFEALDDDKNGVIDPAERPQQHGRHHERGHDRG
ncbi:EF-hand domain-containing protein [Zavarzinia sp. CC-PAN008]|uniref:EF-hand domain-containing protein n=1 Tax=Zavarzinia sp. CC-PAN008 TaxID=3243332 RepID=UPI003F743F20